MEDYAYILDFLPLNNAGLKSKEPLCYAIGSEEFKLFELVPKQGAIINLDDKVYIGKEVALRTHIDHVKRRISYDDLTTTATSELEFVIKDIVMSNEAKYVNFYNVAGPISLKKHALEELPGLGKKIAQEIVGERKKGPFKDFEDIKARVPTLKDPAKCIIDRIILEISDVERRHYLFIVK